VERRNFLSLAAIATACGAGNLVSMNKKPEVPKTTGLASVGLKFDREQADRDAKAYRDEQERAYREQQAKLYAFEDELPNAGEQWGHAMEVPFATLPITRYVRGDVIVGKNPRYPFFDEFAMDGREYGFGHTKHCQRRVATGLEKELEGDAYVLDSIPAPLMPKDKPGRIMTPKFIWDVDEAIFDGTIHARAAWALIIMYKGLTNEVIDRVAQARACYRDDLPPNRWEGPIIVTRPRVTVTLEMPMVEINAYCYCMWQKQAQESFLAYQKEFGKDSCPSSVTTDYTKSIGYYV